MKREFVCCSCKIIFNDYISNRKSVNVFCSRKCKGSFMSQQKGEGTPRWKNARTDHNQGYLLITRNGNTQLEHRYVMEKYLGRKLNRNEEVHHINGNKKDNRIENLEIKTASDHRRFHYYKRGGVRGELL